MKIEVAQQRIKEFDTVRGWGAHWNLKYLSLNITEEVGELWNLVKWIDDEKQKHVVAANKTAVSDFVGDTLFLILKIANQTHVDAGTALLNTLAEYEQRMPPETMQKVGHANTKAGGIDNK